jgi:dTDP-4-amino-4,6-dideoxygalactose transaminase
MKYLYSSPNLRIIDVLKALLLTDNKAEKSIKYYFSELTGKKYILITNSCRTALYLAYKAIGKSGEVITSPLTCKAAIDPIVESGNKPIFADIRVSDLNIDPDDIAHRINHETFAIQVIHLGGIPCDMEKIIKIAQKNKLWVIEDCAQSLGALNNDEYTGTFGDIACFSLIKNSYGIGGGILSTDSYSVYNEALKANQGFSKTPLKLVIFRTIRNVIATKRRYKSGNFLYKILMKLKGEISSYQSVDGQLFQISRMEKRVASRQIEKYPELHQKRKKIGKVFYDLLSSQGILMNKYYNSEKSSFTKLFVYNPVISSKKVLQRLNGDGIEAMHLEHKHGSPYQERLVSSNQILQWRLLNYDKVHNHLISLPISEALKKKHVDYILDKLKMSLKN